MSNMNMRKELRPLRLKVKKKWKNLKLHANETMGKFARFSLSLSHSLDCYVVDEIDIHIYSREEKVYGT